MKRYLLDTHVFVWFVMDPAKLPDDIHLDLRRPENIVYISAATYWEIAMNRNRGRMNFQGDVSNEVRGAKFIELPITGAHGEAAVALPEIHKDPFDRLLVAQALTEGLILVTRDRLLASYCVPIVRV